MKKTKIQTKKYLDEENNSLDDEQSRNSENEKSSEVKFYKKNKYFYLWIYFSKLNLETHFYKC